MKTIEPDRPDFVDPPWHVRKWLPAAANDRGGHEISHTVTFAEEPVERQLAEEFDCMFVSSDTRAEDDPRRFRISPGRQIPLWMINPLMIAMIMAGVALIWFSNTGLSKWGMSIVVIGFGSIATTQFKSLMNWINQLKGTADFFVLDKVTGDVVLPRVGLVLSKMEIKRIVELVPNERSSHQVAILIKDDAALQPTALWIYAYTFSSFGGTSSKVAQKLANALSIPLEELSVPFREA